MRANLKHSLASPRASVPAKARIEEACIVHAIFARSRVVRNHLGGGICDVIGRLDYAYELLDFSVFLGPYEPMMIKHPPRHYLKMLYLDSACYWAPAAECALKSVGEDHFLFATDSPPMVPLKKKGFDLMSHIGMTQAQYNKVMGANAARLLKLN